MQDEAKEVLALIVHKQFTSTLSVHHSLHLASFVFTLLSVAESHEVLPKIVELSVRKALCSGDVACKRFAVKLLEQIVAFDANILPDRVLDIIKVNFASPLVLQLEIVEL